MICLAVTVTFINMNVGPVSVANPLKIIVDG